MPKKFAGENSKAAVARQRKEAARSAEAARKQAALEDEMWKDDDKHANKKQQRKLEKDHKREEQLERKRLNRQLLDAEEAGSKQSSSNSGEKVTRAEIARRLDELQGPAAGKEKWKPAAGVKQQANNDVDSEHDEADLPPLETNINRLHIEGESARTVDEAITVLRGQGPAEKHPEKRMKAAYLTFEEHRLPALKKAHPNLRMSQVKQMLKKEWMKSPENPMNKPFASYNA